MYPKSHPVRSKKLRDAARGQPCTLRLPGCDGGGETTVPAHLPHGGRGMARKASDLHICFACRSCHDVIDKRKTIPISRSDLLEDCLRAIAETQQRLVDDGIIHVEGDSEHER